MDDTEDYISDGSDWSAEVKPEAGASAGSRRPARQRANVNYVYDDDDEDDEDYVIEDSD